MQELSIEEMEEVSGGLGPAAGIAINVAVSLGTAYTYESLGGAAGINSAVSSGWSSYKVFMADSALRLSSMR